MHFLKPTVPVLLFFFGLGASALTAQKTYPPKPIVEEVFVITRHVPGFPGCGRLRRGPEKKQCEEKMLQRFIHDNLVYPELAKKKRKEGTAVVCFYVEKNGTVSPQKIIENPGMGMGEEAMRLLELMVRQGRRWTCGSSAERVYRTLFHLSIEFRLKRNKYESTPSTLVQILEEAETYPWVADTVLVPNSAFLVSRLPDLAPIFPGGDSTLSSQEQQEHISDHLRAYFSANFKHQNADVHLGEKGDFTISFLLDKSGRFSNISVDRDPGGGIAAAAVRVMNQMIKEDIRWPQGKKERVSTTVKVSIPISLIPKGEEAMVQVKKQARIAPIKWVANPVSAPPPPLPLPPKTAASKKEFMLAANMEEPPLFPGCDHLGSYAEKQQCAAGKLDEFIQGNLCYPAKATAYGTFGTALVSFIVEKNGRVTNGKTLHDPGLGTGNEALRVVNLMNTKGLKFDPQSSSGRVVRVQYNLPVKFKLE